MALLAYRRIRRVLVIVLVCVVLTFMLNLIQTNLTTTNLTESTAIHGLLPKYEEFVKDKYPVGKKGKQLKEEEDEFIYQDQLKKLNHQQSPKVQQEAATKELTNSEKLNNNILKANEYLVNHFSLSSADLEKLKLATKISLPYENSRLEKLHSTLKDVFKLYKDSEPSVESLGRYKNSKRIYHAGFDTAFDPDQPVFTEGYLKQFLDLTEDELSSMKDSHSSIVNGLPEFFPEGVFKGNGIVYVGGGSFNWLVMLSIKTLRYLGSELPVEVIIPKVEEYELDLCGRVFPALGARCVLLPHVLGADVVEQFTFFGYQYKALALLASSFENVLLLDSDNVPALKPDYLFESEPYASKGMILWPDFWKRATSPYFYDIANIEIGNERVRYGYNNYGIYEAGVIREFETDSRKIPLHDRVGTIPDPTSESGQLLISKKLHAKTLLLSLYYNLYGPSHYYPLFSQGSDGEGDKETFLAAAVVLNKPYYQVNKFLNAFGHFDEDRNFIGCGMGQYDPVEDFEILSENLNLLNYHPDHQQKYLTSFQQAKDSGISLNLNTPKLLFIHANFPKLNPIELKNKGKLFDRKGERIRLYGEGMPKRVGYDFELVQWTSMYSLVCELKIEVDTFKEISRAEICEEINQQLSFLEKSIDTLET